MPRLVIFILLLLNFVSATGYASPFTISVEQNNVFLEALLPELLSEAKLEAKIVTIPSRRALVELNEGRIDANGLRLRILEERYPNIIKMDEPVLHIDFIAITKRDNIIVKSWADLAPYKVAYPAGWKIFDVNVPTNTNVTKVNDHMQLFNLLEIDRVDVVLLSKTIANTLLKNRKDHSFLLLNPPLHSTPSYLFFHKSRQEEAHKMAVALRRLKANGLYDSLKQHAY
ncbi:MAG: substrate-binding periplasmic protein [Terasakiella sp.]|uniref:substrate-binding periplasmic protein n=1 Tax=unclassified Terasakiella TaxID=2614952 RepID=UPI003AFF8DD8